MANPGGREVERNPAEILLDELRGINLGVERLAAAVEDLADVLAAATGVELTDEGADVDDSDEYRNSAAGQTMGALGGAISEFFRQMSNPRSPDDKAAQSK